MSEEARDWERVARALRRKMGLCPPTPEEADAEMLSAGEIPMRPGEIDRIVKGVTGGDVPHASVRANQQWVDTYDTGEMAEDTRLVMNRNAGDESDEEVDELQKRQREEAINDDDEDENKT